MPRRRSLTPDRHNASVAEKAYWLPAAHVSPVPEGAGFRHRGPSPEGAQRAGQPVTVNPPRGGQGGSRRQLAGEPLDGAGMRARALRKRGVAEALFKPSCYQVKFPV